MRRPAGLAVGFAAAFVAVAGSATGAQARVTAAPLVTAVVPVRAPAGSLVAVGGRNLGGLRDVSIGGTRASFRSLGPYGFYFRVPRGAKTGRLVVVTSDGRAASVVFAVGGPRPTSPPPTPIPSRFLPTLESMIPSAGAPGSTTRISGKNISDVRSVWFGKLRARFRKISPREIAAVVPATAKTAKVTVRTQAGAATTSVPFRIVVDVGPVVTAMLPSRGQPGTKVTLEGRRLAGTTSVSFSGTPAAFTVVSATEVTTVVPRGARTGYVRLETPKGSTQTDIVFTVP